MVSVGKSSRHLANRAWGGEEKGERERDAAGRRRGDVGRECAQKRISRETETETEVLRLKRQHQAP